MASRMKPKRCDDYKLNTVRSRDAAPPTPSFDDDGSNSLLAGFSWVSTLKSFWCLVVFLLMLTMFGNLEIQTAIRARASRSLVVDDKATITRSKKGKSIAVLISGQCSRFIYKDQTIPFFVESKKESFKMDVYITLQCGKQFQPMTGDYVDTPRYMESINCTDIEQWYLAKGANKVEIKLFDDETMERKFDMITNHVTRIKGMWEWKGVNNLRNVLERLYFDTRENPSRTSKPHRWNIEARKLFLRHSVYHMSRQSQIYSGYVYVREDNYFLTPLDLDEVYFSKNKANEPFVVVDEYCTFFGSYSDKMYVANEKGADLLFGRTMTDFLQQMKLFVLFAYYRKEKTFEPMQPEAFIHDNLRLATVETYNMKRIDVRYRAGKRCVPYIYHCCVSEENRLMIQEHGLVVCEEIQGNGPKHPRCPGAMNLGKDQSTKRKIVIP